MAHGSSGSTQSLPVGPHGVTAQGSADGVTAQGSADGVRGHRTPRPVGTLRLVAAGGCVAGARVERRGIKGCNTTGSCGEYSGGGKLAESA